MHPQLTHLLATDRRRELTAQADRARRAACRHRGRRTRLAVVLPVALAVVLPSAAHAGEAFVSGDGVLSYVDPSNRENNDVLLRVEGGKIVITDRGAPVESSSSACQVVSASRVECPANVTVDVSTFGDSDKVEYRLPHEGFVSLGDGVVMYDGGPGHDKMDYGGADRGVSVTPEDGLANDGRPGDREKVETTFEEFVGSNFDDGPLFGTPHTDLMDGGPGNDQIAGGGGGDVFVASPGDGADDYHGGPGRDTLEYFRFSTPVTVSLDNVANDGAVGERDQVRSNVENLFGGSAADTSTSFGAFSQLDGRGGNDMLLGGSGPDTLSGGPGSDTLDAGSGGDVVFARDGAALDDVECGADTDSATIDSGERTLRNCESLDVGTLRLAAEQLEPDAATVRVAR